MASWRENSESSAAWIRQRPIALAVALIATLASTKLLSILAQWFSVDPTISTAVEGSEWLSFEGLRSGLGQLLWHVRISVGPTDFNYVIGWIGILFVLSWLYDLPFKRLPHKLGFGRPRIVEVFLPLIAYVPVVLMILFVYKLDSAEPSETSEFSLGSWFSFALDSLTGILLYAVVFRGLLYDCGARRSVALGVVLGIVLLQITRAGYVREWTWSAETAASIVLLSVFRVLFNSFLVLAWRGRVWTVWVSEFALQVLMTWFSARYAIAGDYLRAVTLVSIAPYVLLLPLIMLRKETWKNFRAKTA